MSKIWVGLLTPEKIAAVFEVVGDAPVCISEARTRRRRRPRPTTGRRRWAGISRRGRRPAGLRVSGHPHRPCGTERDVGSARVPRELPASTSRSTWSFPLWSVTVALVPGTRLDDVVVEGSLVYVVIPTIPDEMGCTADWVPRTYLVSVDRDRLRDLPSSSLPRTNIARHSRGDHRSARATGGRPRPR